MAAAVPADNRILATFSQKYYDFHESSDHDKISVHDFYPIRILGRGAMGIVLLAVHRKLQKPFALKVMSKSEILRRRCLHSAQTEMDVLARLEHPFLPTLHSCFESASYNFLVLNYCSGGDLNVLRHKQPEKRFSEAATRFYAAELLLALEYLHGLGFAYRDLKPENVLLSDSGHVVLADFDLCLRLQPQVQTPVEPALDAEQDIKQSFDKPNFMFSCFRASIVDPGYAIARDRIPVRCGSARRSRTPGNTSVGGYNRSIQYRYNSETVVESVKHFIGTEEYVAPEVLLGQYHDFAVDWWAFGVLLYELVYGKTPFKGTNRKRTFFNILYKEPEALCKWDPLQDLIQKLLVKEPGRRLGHSKGAVELKEHVFFRGVKWDNLQHVARPPIVPGSEEILVRSNNQVSLDLETYMATVLETHRTDSMSESSDKKSVHFSDEELVDSDCGSSISANQNSQISKKEWK